MKRMIKIEMEVSKRLMPSLISVHTYLIGSFISAALTFYHFAIERVRTDLIMVIEAVCFLRR